jgi:integrase
VAVARGVSFEHKKGTSCTDAKFHRHCHGRWRGSISLGFGASGQRIRRRVTAATKTACLEEMARLREELGQAPRASKTYTVRQAVDDWLADGLPGRSERTRNAYLEALTPLLAKVGHRPLRELTAVEVKNGLKSLSSKYSTRYLQITRNSLERTIRFAQIHQRVGHNVAELIETPRGKQGRPSQSLTLAQAQALLKAAENERLYAYIVVSLLSGIRTEEIRSLRWDDVITWVDDSTGWLPVSEVGFDVATASEPRFAILVWRADRAGGDTKTSRSRRSVALPGLCVDALRKQWDRQQKDRLIAGAQWQEHRLVFASAVGTPQLAGNIRRGFRSVCKTAKIGEHWTPRELRHTFVSLMSESGMPVEEISHLVGHSSTQVTETVYRHELRPVLRTGADAMDKLFPGHRDPD